MNLNDVLKFIQLPKPDIVIDLESPFDEPKHKNENESSFGSRSKVFLTIRNIGECHAKNVELNMKYDKKEFENHIILWDEIETFLKNIKYIEKNGIRRMLFSGFRGTLFKHNNNFVCHSKYGTYKCQFDLNPFLIEIQYTWKILGFFTWTSKKTHQLDVRKIIEGGIL